MFKKMMNALIEARTRQAAFTVTRRELSHLTERELADIGIAPGDINHLAFQSGEMAVEKLRAERTASTVVAHDRVVAEVLA